MIQVENLVKTFDGFRALDGADFHVKKGAIYGLVGPNGAGKSTLIRHLTGIYKQDEGSVLIDGEPVFENPAVKEKMALDVDVAKLKLLKANHMNNQYRLEDDIARNFPQQIAKLTEIIDSYKADIAHFSEHKITDPEQFSMEISGKVFTEKKEAGTALLAVCKDIKSVDAAMDIGSYQGFNMRIQFDSWSKEFILSVKHESVAKVRLGADALGNITRINNLLESYPEKLAEADSIIKPSDNAVASKDSDGQAQSDSGQTEEENVTNTAAETENEPETKAAAATTKTLHFAEEDGLNWPLQGNVVLNYSMDQTVYFATLDQYKYNPAVIIAGEVNDRVSAAAEGKITDISNSAVTGCTVTMDLGDGYSAIYGQLKEVPYEVGDIVGKGKLVGYIAEPTKYYSVEGSNLYFALQKDGEPVDPVSFFE